MIAKTKTVRYIKYMASEDHSAKGQAMYHGSRNSELSFFPAICFTSCSHSAASYGSHLHAVEIDETALSIRTIEMSEEELRDAIDNQEWPCDRQSEIDTHIAAGYDAVRYSDVDECGQSHDCLRILTAAAFAAAVSIDE